jgi:hypothetical protein
VVLAKHVDRDSLILGPDFCYQRLNTLPADTLSPFVTLDEELAQIEMIFFFSVKCIS